jgi:mannose-6-phosphate isomerase-like protein (cupin superfamily)
MRCFVTIKTTLAIALFLIAAATPNARQAAATTSKPGSLALTIAGENGVPLSGANVRLSGATNDRAGTSGADGLVTLVNLPPGTYRARITRDGYVTLEKEVTIRAGSRLATEAVVTAAPPPPAPPPPPQAPPAPAASSSLKPGSPSYSSIIDLVAQMEKALRDTPTVERELGCSGASASRLIMTRENITMHSHADADEMLYIVAGEATLSVADKDQGVQAAWFSVVPRGMSHSLTRRGRNPLLVLSVRSGPACPGL